jgi:predicted nucleotidyltransferase
MNRPEVLERLRRLKPRLLEEASVREIAIFGSVARDEAGPDSDIDIIVAFDRPPGYFAFVDLEAFLSEALGAKVDLFTEAALHPRLREQILREAIYA